MIGYYIFMEIDIQPGKYIVAVSGGVDSIVLLDILTHQNNLELAIAHLDHGIRKESHLDHDFVKKLSEKYGLKFFSKRVELGQNASEDNARKVRYDFLDSAMKSFEAKSIITAHHQDDILETATFNMLRGTGRSGLSSLKSTPKILRPLLRYSKLEILEYAKTHQLDWVEDKTNQDTRYSRNYIRHKMLAKLNHQSKDKLITLVNNTRDVNSLIDKELNLQLHKNLKDNKLDKHWFIMLPNNVAEEVVAYWFRQSGLGSFDKKIIHRSVVAIKTFKSGKQSDIYGGSRLIIEDQTVAIIR